MAFLRDRPLLTLWIVIACALVVAAPWNWLPLAICAPWVAAVIWVALRNPDDESAAQPSSAEVARRRLTIR